MGSTVTFGIGYNTGLQPAHEPFVLEGMASQPVKVKSGVPQGTVLGPLMFLLYINDIADDIKHSSVRLFADDCLLYRVVDTKEDECKLQRDLFELELWSNKWQLDFNIK